jgi:hypothetical protein
MDKQSECQCVAAILPLELAWTTNAPASRRTSPEVSCPAWTASSPGITQDEVSGVPSVTTASSASSWGSSAIFPTARRPGFIPRVTLGGKRRWVCEPSARRPRQLGARRGFGRSRARPSPRDGAQRFERDRLDQMRVESRAPRLQQIMLSATTRIRQPARRAKYSPAPLASRRCGPVQNWSTTWRGPPRFAVAAKDG